MSKEATKLKILVEGAKIVHEKGFNNTGIQEILNAAGVPKGSFYFYFKSKEEFGLAVIDYFMTFMGNWIDSHLNSTTTPPLKSLKNFFDAIQGYFQEKGCKSGCPIGNITQEMADLSNPFRAKLEQAFHEMKTKIGRCLETAQERNDLEPTIDPYEIADFILNSWEGALLRMKAKNSIEPLITFDKMVFGMLLRNDWMPICVQTSKGRRRDYVTDPNHPTGKGRGKTRRAV